MTAYSKVKFKKILQRVASFTIPAYAMHLGKGICQPYNGDNVLVHILHDTILSKNGLFFFSVNSAYIDNNTYPFPYHSLYQPETLILTRGPKPR